MNQSSKPIRLPVTAPDIAADAGAPEVSKNSCLGLEHPARRGSRSLGPRVLSALLLALSGTRVPLHAANPPAATLIFSTTNSANIHGGVATIGSSGDIYFSTLSSPGTYANVMALNLSGTQPKWTFNAPDFGTNYDMYPVPALDAAGLKLYIGSDVGTFYCLDTSANPAQRVVWQYPPQGYPRLTDKIRSGAALDPNNPLGSTVYFHCNDGYLYALDANTGAQRWRAHTFNEGGPSTNPNKTPPYLQPLSSAPAVSATGIVYVGSKNGTTVMDVTVGPEIEAPVVIGNKAGFTGPPEAIRLTTRPSLLRLIQSIPRSFGRRVLGLWMRTSVLWSAPSLTRRVLFTLPSMGTC